MRGANVETGAMSGYLSPEKRVPKDHPLRAIRVIVDRSLAELDGHFHSGIWTARLFCDPPLYW